MLSEHDKKNVRFCHSIKSVYSNRPESRRLNHHKSIRQVREGNKKKE